MEAVDSFELLKAAASSDEARVAQLLALGASPAIRDVVSRATPLHCAAGAGHLAVVARFLDAGADPSAHNTDADESPMGSALIAGRLDVVRLLLARGARLSPSEVESGLLGEARSLGYGEVVELIEAQQRM